MPVKALISRAVLAIAVRRIDILTLN